MRKYKIIILVSIFAFFPAASFCQNTYAVTNAKKVYQVNDDFSMTYKFTAGPTEYLINDIAISPSGNMYGIAYNSLYQINVTNGEASWIADFPPNFYVSLVCSSENELYAINNLQNTLCKYDLQTNVFSTVANLGYATSGDLAYYKGNLIFQTYSDDAAMYMIKAFNLQTGSLKDVMCQPFYFQLWGLANYGDCDGEMILAVNPTSEFLEIDLEAQTYETHGFSLPDGQQIFGLARSDESTWSECAATELTDLNCLLGTGSHSINKFTIYPNPAGSQIYFNTNTAILEIKIYDLIGNLLMETFGSDIHSINVENLPTGVYLILAKGNNSNSTTKFLKK